MPFEKLKDFNLEIPKKFHILNAVNPADNTEMKEIKECDAICFYIKGETKFIWYGRDPRIYEK